MDKFTRSAHGDGARFTAFYNRVQLLLKKQGKQLDSKHKRICEDILKEGEKFFDPYPAKSHREYENILKDFVKDNEKLFEKVELYLRDEAA